MIVSFKTNKITGVFGAKLIEGDRSERLINHLVTPGLKPVTKVL